MSEKPDITQRPGWKAVERWLKANELPPPKTPMHEPMAKWGTRGLITGCAVGFVFVLAAIVLGMLHDDAVPISGKVLLGFPIFMGLLGIPCALVGMLIGFAVWICRRK